MVWTQPIVWGQETACTRHYHLNKSVLNLVLSCSFVYHVYPDVYFLCLTSSSVSRVTLPGRNLFPGDEKRMPATLTQVLVATQTPWQKFGIELVLSFVVVYTYFVTMDSHRRWLGGSALGLGAAYLSCSLVAVSTVPLPYPVIILTILSVYKYIMSNPCN